MDPFVTIWIFLIGVIAGVILGLTLVYRTAIYPLHKKIERLTKEKLLLTASHGKLPEHLPLIMEKYPYNTENFRYIGDPVDGLQFEDDCIIFVDFTNQKKPDSVKNNIKKLVEKGKVEWFES